MIELQVLVRIILFIFASWLLLYMLKVVFDAFISYLIDCVCESVKVEDLIWHKACRVFDHKQEELEKRHFTK